MTTIEAAVLETLYGELVSSSVAPTTIPLSPLCSDADLAGLRGDDGLEIAVSIAPGKGSNGTYAESSIRRFVDVVRDKTLAGYLGHTRPEDYSSEFRMPAVHYVGADWREGRGLFRGVVDQGVPDVKRLIRSRRITSVSIHYANPRRERRGAEMAIVDLEPLSIDLVPLHRQGMSSASISGAELQKPRGGRRAMPGENDHPPTVDELVGELRQSRATVPEVVRGMGWSAKDIAPNLGATLAEIGPIVDAGAWGTFTTATTTVGELATLLECKPEEVLGRTKTLQGELVTLRQAQRDGVVDRVIADWQPVIAEGVRWVVRDGLLGELGKLPSWTEAEAKVELPKLLEQDRYKALLSTAVPTTRSAPASSSTSSSPAPIRTTPPAVAGGIRYVPGRRV